MSRSYSMVMISSINVIPSTRVWMTMDLTWTLLIAISSILLILSYLFVWCIGSSIFVIIIRLYSI